MTDEQIIEALAVKVMGWRKDSVGGTYLWNDSNGFVAPPTWNPLEHCQASKQVREKLAELGWRRQRLERSWIEPHVYHFEVEWKNPETGYYETVRAPLNEPFADTEERAVALCALKTVGVEP